MTGKVDVRRNLIANFVGKAWAGIVSLLVLPMYVKILGVEAYGLIGLFLSLSAISTVLDLGLTTTINRQLARLSLRDDSAQEARDLTRTFETVYWAIGLLIGLSMVLLAPFIAHQWVHPHKLSVQTVQQAIMLMGLMLFVQWPVTFYIGGLMGLQRQVVVNLISIVTITMASMGALISFKLFSPTIQVYFTWQSLVAGMQTLLLMRSLWTALPQARVRARFRVAAWTSHWKTTRNMTAIALTSIILLQTDKVVLSKTLSLQMFGYYTFATTISTYLLALTAPVLATVFPRLSQLASGPDQSGLARLYHTSCQILSVMLMPIWMALALFSRELLPFYIHDRVTVLHVAPLVSLLITGMAFTGIVSAPFSLMLASGWTRLPLQSNLIAVLLYLPVLLILIHFFGAVGAAIAWILEGVGYFLLQVPVMHTRLLRGEMWSWYRRDVGIPLAITLSIGLAARLLIRDNWSLKAAACGVLIALFFALVGSLLSLPIGRSIVAKLLRTGTVA